MDLELLHQLLLHGEGPRLDYKVAPYPFAGTSDGQKAELLKDVLAMANAWGSGDAYILIGVQEPTAGTPAQVVGITAHLDDSDLQQFVNQKTNRPISFEYSEFECAGKNLAAICIHEEQRPFFLLKQFDGAMPNTVYVRRGSSTDIADPAEVYEMGKSAAVAAAVPTLQLQFGELALRKGLGISTKLARTALEPLPDSRLPQIRQRSLPHGLDSLSVLNRPNLTYYREMRDYISVTQAVAKLAFVMSNSSRVLAAGVRAQFRLPADHRLLISDYLPSKPRRLDDAWLMHRVDYQTISSRSRELVVDRLGDEWHIEIRFGSVQPGCEKWADDPLYFGTTEPMTVVFQGKIVGDNLTPIPVQLKVESEPKMRAMTVDDLEGDGDQRAGTT